MNLDRLRFILAVVGLLAVIAAIPLIVFFGAGMNSVQVGLLTLFGGALISEVKSSSAFTWDGTPKPDPDPVPADPVKTEDAPK